MLDRRMVESPLGPGRTTSPLKALAVDIADNLEGDDHAGAEPAEPTVGATAELIEVLDQRGACFAAELAGATRRPPTTSTGDCGRAWPCRHVDGLPAAPPGSPAPVRPDTTPAAAGVEA